MTDRRAPVPFHPAMEQIDPQEEAKVAGELAETMVGISRKTFADGGRRLRSVHAKAHAVVRGTLEVLPGLPPAYAQGLFATPGRFGVVMRFSSVPGDILPDRISTPRGLAIKVLKVPGARLPESEDPVQDFVLVNGPAFAAPSPAAFLANLKLLAATTDRVEGLKEVVSTVAGVAEKAVEAFGGQSPLLKTLGGEPQHHPAGETYHSQTPLLWGDFVGKVSVAPTSPALTALSGTDVAVGDDPDGLRHAMSALFQANGGGWDPVSYTHLTLPTICSV